VRWSLAVFAGALVCAGACGGHSGQACDTSAPACACDSQSPACQPVLANLCLGSHCPPSLDDALLVANWSLDPNGDTDPNRVQGTYQLDANGTRFFSLVKSGTYLSVFGFDAQGRMLIWFTGPTAGCLDTLCSSSGLQNSPATWACTMVSNPEPAGSFKYPPGASNPPEPSCEVDGSGRWFMAGMDPGLGP
jgi:hypothetical protein